MEYITIASFLLTVVGIGLLSYGLYRANELRNILETGELKEAWDILSVLIVSFLIGYAVLAAYMAGLLPINLQMSGPAQMLVSVIFALGSVFVAATAHLNTQVYRV
jgi:hypothetical protein